MHRPCKKGKKFKVFLSIAQGILGISVIGVGKVITKIPVSAIIPIILAVLALFKAISSRKMDKKLHADRDESITFSVQKTKTKSVTDYPTMPGTDYAQIEVTLKNKEYAKLFTEANRSIIEKKTTNKQGIRMSWISRKITGINE